MERWGSREKKLIEAARHWAHGTPRAASNPEALAADAAAMGLPPEDVAQLVDHAGHSDQDDTLEIMAENWPTVAVFLALSTQWRREIPAMSDRVLWHGIPHSEIEPTIRLMGYTKSARRIFDGLKIMEAEALPLLNSR